MVENGGFGILTLVLRGVDFGDLLLRGDFRKNGCCGGGVFLDGGSESGYLGDLLYCRVRIWYPSQLMSVKESFSDEENFGFPSGRTPEFHRRSSAPD
jgi:hypothetical protein